jgi:CubicO group peptidase (beta-lactamase class C family)
MRLLLYGVLVLLLSGCTLGRRLFLNAPGYNDQFRFPAAELAPAPEPFAFKRPSDDLRLGERIRVVPTVLALGTESMEDYLRHSATQAFLIIRNDTLLYENYFRGIGPSDPVTSFSIAKTFVGGLVGIALEEGLIRSQQDPVQTYLPDFPFADVTIEHLLNHTSGLQFPAEGWLYYSDKLHTLLDKPLDRRARPGSTFRYENGNTQLLGMVLEAASGIPLTEFMQQRIWSRIGTEGPARWSTDKSGLPKAFCCLNATALDFARFGRLLMNKGVWEGQEVVPRAFWEESVRGDTLAGQFIRYKNHLWLEGEDAGIYLAAGLYGQYLYVYPPKNILIVRFARENLHLHAAWSEFFQTVIAQL